MYNFIKTYFKIEKHKQLIERRIVKIRNFQIKIYQKRNYEIFDLYCWFVSNDSEISYYMRCYYFNKLLKNYRYNKLLKVDLSFLDLSFLENVRHNSPTKEKIIKFLSNGTEALNLILKIKQQPEKNLNVMIRDLERCINLFSNIAYYVIERRLEERLEKLQYKLNKLLVN